MCKTYRKPVSSESPIQIILSLLLSYVKKEKHDKIYIFVHDKYSLFFIELFIKKWLIWIRLKKKFLYDKRTNCTVAKMIREKGKNSIVDTTR